MRRCGSPRGEELDPLSPAPQIVSRHRHYWARGTTRRWLIPPHPQVNPRFSYANFFLALAHIQKHEYDEALEALSVPGAGGGLQQETLRGTSTR